MCVCCVSWFSNCVYVDVYGHSEGGLKGSKGVFPWLRGRRVYLSTLLLPRESFSHCCCNSQAPGSMLFVTVYVCFCFLSLRVCVPLRLAGSRPGHCVVVHYCSNPVTQWPRR